MQTDIYQTPDKHRAPDRYRGPFPLSKHYLPRPLRGVAVTIKFFKAFVCQRSMISALHSAVPPKSQAVPETSHFTRGPGPPNRNTIVTFDTALPKMRATMLTARNQVRPQACVSVCQLSYKTRAQLCHVADTAPRCVTTNMTKSCLFLRVNAWVVVGSL